MFKQFSLAAFLLVCAVFKLQAQQPVLVQGQYVNTVIATANSGSNGDCLPDFDFQLSPDSVFRYLATGVKLYAVVTSLTLQMPNSLVTSYGAVALGDTLPFDTTDTYKFTFYSQGLVDFEFRAIGTPTVPGESYYCDPEVLYTLALCGNAVYLSQTSPGPNCQVQPMNSIPEALGKGWKIYPVPAKDRFQLQHIDGLSTWSKSSLLDLQGKVLRTWEAGEELEVKGFSQGIYLLKIESDEGMAVKRFQIE